MVTLSSLHCHLLFLTNQPCLLILFASCSNIVAGVLAITSEFHVADQIISGVSPKHPALDLNKYHCQLVSYPHVNRILGFFFFLYFFPPDKHMSVILLGRKKTRMDIVGATSFFFSPPKFIRKNQFILCAFPSLHIPQRQSLATLLAPMVFTFMVINFFLVVDIIS